MTNSNSNGSNNNNSNNYGNRILKIDAEENIQTKDGLSQLAFLDFT